MQTPKISLVICALALVSTPTIRAVDNPAQAAARAALVSKLFEVSTPPKTNAPVVAERPVVPKVAVTVAPPVVVVKSDGATVTEPVLVPVSRDAKAKAKAQAKADKLAAEAKAKADAQQIAADKQAKKVAEKMAAEKKSAEAAAAKAKAKVVVPMSVKIEPAPVAPVQAAPKMMVAPNGDNAAQAAARAALAQKLFETPPAKSGWEAPSQPAPKTVVKAAPKLADKPAPVKVEAPKANYTTSEPELKKFDAPASPLPATKQQKLQALLAKYKGDQITPEDYFNQRAAILAEP